MAETTARIRLAIDGSAQITDGFARVEDSLASVARAAEQTQRRIGASSAQTAAALRMVPAQFTDIITSLQGGQAPLTVFLQQGGQLRDMFGSAGAAARALGGYVAGLITPLNLAAAATGALALAAFQGSKESQAYARALILTGNAAGTTADQLSSMAASLKDVAGTQGKAAAALAVFAESGAVGRSQLEKFTGSALVFAKATGQGVDEVAKNFAALAKDPLGATLKLNEGMNYLTESTYRQIKSLTEQGRALEAASIAQQAYADVVDSRGKAIIQNLGYIERAWSGLTGVAKGAWDAMMGLGRTVTPAQEIQSLEKMLENAEALRAKMRARGQNVPSADSEEMGAARERLAFLQTQVREARKLADIDAERAATVKARLKADQEGLKYLTDQQRMQREIVDQTATLVAAGASRVEIEKRVALIRASYAKNTPEPKPQVDTELKELIKLSQDRQVALTKEREAVAQLTLADYQASVARVQGLNDRVRGLQDEQAAQALAAAGNISLAQAVEQVTIQRLQEKKARLIEGSPAYEDLERELEVRRRLLLVMAESTSAASLAGVDARIKGLREELQAQLLSTQSNFSLSEAVEHLTIARLEERKAQLIEGSPAAEALQLEIDKRKELMAVIADKATFDKSRAMWESIDRTAQSVFVNVFEGGSNSFKRLGQTLKAAVLDLLYQLTVKKWIVSIGASFTGSTALASLGQGASGSASGASNLLSLGSLASNVYKGGASFLNGAFIDGKVAGAWQGTSNWLAGSSNATASSAGQWMNANPQVAGYMGMAGNALAGYGIQKGISGGYKVGSGEVVDAITLAASAYFGPIAGVAAGIFNRAFGRKAREITDQGISGTFSANEGANVQNFSNWFQKGGWFRSNRSGTSYLGISDEMDTFLDAAVKATATATKEYAAVVGLSADAVSGFSKSVNISLMGLDAAGQEKAIADAISGFGEDLANLVLGEAGRALQQQGETAAAALARLAGALSGVNDVLKSLGQSTLATSLTGASNAQALLNLFGGLDAFTQSASAYLQAFYTDAERLTLAQTQLSEAMAALGLSVPGSTAAFRALVEAQDLATEGGRSTYAALLKLAPAFAEVDSAVANTAKALKDSASGIEGEIQRLRGLITGTGSANAASLQADFALTTASARAGDAAALQRLPGISQALEAAAALQATTAADLARLRGQLSASLEATMAALGLQVPQFAVGTNYVPRDMLARIHEGEAIVPRAYNPAAGGQGLGNTARLEAQVEQLTQEVKNLHAAMAADVGHNAKTARILERITPNGTALNTVVEAA